MLGGCVTCAVEIKVKVFLKVLILLEFKIHPWYKYCILYFIFSEYLFKYFSKYVFDPKPVHYYIIQSGLVPRAAYVLQF